MGKATQKKTKQILDVLQKTHPDARIYLDFDSPLELLIATILAAQCTDERVNEVTPVLFDRFPSAGDIAGADPNDIEEIVRSTGFFRQKTKSVQKVCAIIAEQYEGKVPDSAEELATLPGVGRKTANVVAANAFGHQAIAVDTHVKRVSNRLGISTQKNPDKIEMDLCKLIPRRRWTRACHLLGTHGRRICAARKPDCENCPVNHLCDYYGSQAPC